MKKLSLVVLLALASTNFAAANTADADTVIITEVPTTQKQSKGLLGWIKKNPGKFAFYTTATLAATAAAAAIIDTALVNNVESCKHEKFFWNTGLEWVYETGKKPFVQAYTEDDVKAAQKAFAAAATAEANATYAAKKAAVKVETDATFVKEKQKLDAAQAEVTAATASMAAADETTQQAAKTAQEKAVQALEQQKQALEGLEAHIRANDTDVKAAFAALKAAEPNAKAKIDAVINAGAKLAQAEAAFKNAADKAAAQQELDAARKAWKDAAKEAPEVASVASHCANKSSNARVFFVEKPLAATGAVLVTVAGAAAVYDLTRGNNSKILKLLGLTKKRKRARRILAAA